MGKLRRVAEAAITLVKHLEGGLGNRVNHRWRQVSAATRERFRLRDRIGDHVRLFDDLAVLFAIGLRDRQQDALETRTPVLILRREVRPTIERFAVGREKSGEGPAALSSER